MTSQPSFKELSEELNKCKAELSKLKNALNGLNAEKESWFGKKEEFSIKIRESIQKIKEIKAKRDSLTKEVKELKLKRDAINTELLSRLDELYKSKAQKAGIAKSLGIKEPPSKIRDSIEKLEFRIETEAMSFEKEKELMKKINGLRKLYTNASILSEINKKIIESFEEISNMRKEKSQIHKLVQEKAKESQMLHEQILAISAGIEKMKADEGQAFGNFSGLKAKFNETNSLFREKLNEMNGIRDSLDKISSERKNKKIAWQESFLKSKEDEVNEKIKRGEKLTTEDLLVFQKFGKG